MTMGSEPWSCKEWKSYRSRGFMRHLRYYLFQRRMNSISILSNPFKEICLFSFYRNCNPNWLPECSHVLELLEEHVKLMPVKKTGDWLSNIWKKASMSWLHIKKLLRLLIVETTQFTFLLNNINIWRNINISYFNKFIFSFSKPFAIQSYMHNFKNSTNIDFFLSLLRKLIALFSLFGRESQRHVVPPFFIHAEMISRVIR